MTWLKNIKINFPQGSPAKHVSKALAGAKKHNAKHTANPKWEHKERSLGKNIKKGLKKVDILVEKGKEKYEETKNEIIN